MWPLWIALGLAFSPVLLDLAGHFAEHAWARYALVFPLLFVRCARRDARVARAAGGTPPARAFGGTLLVAAGLALEIAAAFTGAIRWARPGPVLAAIGMCQREGIASWPSRALLLFAIPLPSFFVKLGERRLASAMGEWAAALWSLGGEGHLLVGSAIRAGGSALVTLNREWLALAPLLAGLAWYDAVLRRRGLPAAVAGCAAGAALAFPLQMLGLVVAIGLAHAGAPGLAQGLVDDGVWLLAALGAVAVTEAQWRRTAETGA